MQTLIGMQTCTVLYIHKSYYLHTRGTTTIPRSSSSPICSILFGAMAASRALWAALVALLRVQLPLGDGANAIRETAREQGLVAGALDDRARLVHHEAERRSRHAGVVYSYLRLVRLPLVRFHVCLCQSSSFLTRATLAHSLVRTSTKGVLVAWVHRAAPVHAARAERRHASSSRALRALPRWDHRSTLRLVAAYQVRSISANWSLVRLSLLNGPATALIFILHFLTIVL